MQKAANHKHITQQKAKLVGYIRKKKQKAIIHYY